MSVPLTYPAWPVNGFLVSGALVAPGPDDRSAFPRLLAERYGGRLSFPEAYRYGASLRDVARAGPAMMIRRRDAVLELLRERPCDLLMVVMGEIDKAQHDFWRFTEPDCLEEDAARYGRVVGDHYAVADEALGAIRSTMGADALVAVVSDHGAGPFPRKQFRTNAWLRQHGALTVRPGLGRRRRHLLGTVRDHLPRVAYGLLQRMKRNGLVQRAWREYSGSDVIDFSLTRAYRVPLEQPAEGVTINLRGRQQMGSVAPEDHDAEVDRVARSLATAVDPESGAKVFAEVHQREDLYCGPFTDSQMPDVVCVFAPDYGAAWGAELPVLRSTADSERERHRGSHRMAGMLAISGPGILPHVRIGEVSILDVMPTLLYAMDLPVPANADGRVLREAFCSPESRPIRVCEPAPARSGSEKPYSEEDAREIASRLDGLGYVR